MAFTFIKDHSFAGDGLTPEEQFNLMMATADIFADEPKAICPLKVVRGQLLRNREM